MAPQDLSAREVVPDLSVSEIFNVKGKTALITGGGRLESKTLTET
jgi:hypothetical protein